MNTCLSLFTINGDPKINIGHTSLVEFSSFNIKQYGKRDVHGIEFIDTELAHFYMFYMVLDDIIKNENPVNCTFYEDLVGFDTSLAENED